MPKTSLDLQVTAEDFQRLDRPPTTKTLQRHFGLSRKEAVRFHKDHDGDYSGQHETYSQWHSHTFRLCQQIKSKRQPFRSGTQPKQISITDKVDRLAAITASQLQPSSSTDISLAKGHQLEASL